MLYMSKFQGDLHRQWRLLQEGGIVNPRDFLKQSFRKVSSQLHELEGVEFVDILEVMGEFFEGLAQYQDAEIM